MSFDVFLQGFAKSYTGGGAAAKAVLLPYLAAEPDDGYAEVVLADGSADVYGLGSEGFMFNHVAGDLAWDLIVDVARAAQWVIVPTGCSTCVLDPSQIPELPEELREDAVVITTGSDLAQVIATT